MTFIVLVSCVGAEAVSLVFISSFNMMSSERELPLITTRMMRPIEMGSYEIEQSDSHVSLLAIRQVAGTGTAISMPEFSQRLNEGRKREKVIGRVIAYARF